MFINNAINRCFELQYFCAEVGVALAASIDSLLQAIKKGLGAGCQEFYFCIQIDVNWKTKLDLIHHFLPMLNISFKSTHPAF
jgi:hypothetical protein